MADMIRKSTHTTAEIDTAVDMLLEVYTREEIDNLLSQKITAVPGMGLISDEEKQTLSEVKNYGSEITLNRSTLGYQRKNLLKNTAKSQTVSGIAFTVNDDGSITANGTAAANAQIVIFDGKPAPEMTNKQMTLSGCPAGGSTSTYRMIIQNATSGFSTICTDTGDGGAAIITSDMTRIRCLFTIYSGKTVENITVYPMLRCAEITDDTYEPYKQSVEERLAALEEKFSALEGGTAE